MECWKLDENQLRDSLDSGKFLLIMTYHLARDGQQLGTFSESEVSSKYSSGQILGTDLCWKEGMADWQPVSVAFNSNGFPAPVINPYAAPRADVSRRSSTSAPVDLANRYARLAAQIIDIAIIGIVASAAIPLIPNVDKETGDASAVYTFLAVGGLLLLAYTVYNIYLLSTQGQTVGKKLMGIRIVRYDDNGTAGFVKAVLLRVFVNGLFGAFPGLGPIYALIDILFIFSDDSRCLHDKLSGTHVVKA